MLITTVFRGSECFCISCNGIRRRRCCVSRRASIVSQTIIKLSRSRMNRNRKFIQPSSLSKKNEGFSLDHIKRKNPQHRSSSMSSEYGFFEQSNTVEKENERMNKLEFGAREAVLDEEYWTAAWLRTEGNWEDRPYERHIKSYKRKYVEQEFNALKRRCKDQSMEKCICIIAEKMEEENAKHTALKSVVGTLDLRILHLLNGESYPGEVVKARIFSTFNRQNQQRYGYISNLCVAKFARRQGIASNILQFAIESAIRNGVKQVFVHVHRENKPAQELYEKMGFQIVDKATSTADILTSFRCIECINLNT